MYLLCWSNFIGIWYNQWTFKNETFEESRVMKHRCDSDHSPHGVTVEEHGQAGVGGLHLDAVPQHVLDELVHALHVRPPTLALTVSLVIVTKGQETRLT